MLTSSQDESDLFTSHDLSVNGFEVKPFGMSALFDAMESIGPFWGVINRTLGNSE